MVRYKYFLCKSHSLHCDLKINSAKTPYEIASSNCKKISLAQHSCCNLLDLSQVWLFKLVETLQKPKKIDLSIFFISFQINSILWFDLEIFYYWFDSCYSDLLICSDRIKIIWYDSNCILITLIWFDMLC